MFKTKSKSTEKPDGKKSNMSLLFARLSPCCCKAFNVFLEYCDVYLLVLGTLAILIAGSELPNVGLFLSSIYAPQICLFACFLLCGLRTTTDEIYTAAKSIQAIIWGLLTILVVFPVAGTQITKTIQFATMTNENLNTSQSSVVGNVTAIGPTEFAIALQVFFIVPASLSSGAILSILANGNFSLALLLMVVTNVAAVFTLPPMLPWMTDLNSTVKYTSFGRVMALFLLITMLPTILGFLLGLVKAVAEKVDSTKKYFRYAIITLFVLYIWPEVSRAQVEEEFYNIVSMNILIIVGYSSIMHIMFLLLNWIAGGFLNLDLPIKKTVVILGSHKALSYAETVLRFLSGDVGSTTLMANVCSIAYLTLFFLDAIIVSKWATVSEGGEEESDKTQNKKYGRLLEDAD